MDQFYLQNAALYQSLVDKSNAAPEILLAKGRMERISTDLIVTARVRPLLDEDLADGFPSAVFPHSAETGAVDIHDLYNHPRGRPVLKVKG